MLGNLFRVIRRPVLSYKLLREILPQLKGLTNAEKIERLEQWQRAINNATKDGQ